MKYKISKELRLGFKNTIVELMKEHRLFGELYFYKPGECSCCYGPEKTDFYINGNIPGNWGVYGGESGYHKVNFSCKTDKAKLIFESLKKNLKSLPVQVSWEGNENSCIMIELK